MENKFKKDELFIAELKYLEDQGVELDSLLSYVILRKKNGIYYNVFDMSEGLPVFERSRHYANCTSDGIEFGTKLIYKYGPLDNGPCWIVGPEFPLDQEEFTKEDLEDFIINDERFFKDRRKVAFNRIKNPIKLYKLLSKDDADYEYMNNYLLEKSFGKTKKI